nr:MAG TPA: hypothetical protein [Caudoviricetes sp.]
MDCVVFVDCKHCIASVKHNSSFLLSIKSYTIHSARTA